MKFVTVAGVVGVGFFTLSYVAFPQLAPLTYTPQEFGVTDELTKKDLVTEEKEAIDTREIISHVPLPSQVKTIYMTSCVAGTLSFRDRLIALIEETEINSVIIDIKDYSGTI